MSIAESLLYNVKKFNKLNPNKLVLAYNETELSISRLTVAIRFSKLPLATQFRALVEEWPLDRIVREINI